ncbi:semaphorin-4B-like [Scomber scombrus]|uniref:Semaphorin-4B-like n=1 Tax=Scomber scombrus TaxID=13677 RepID=A0AAV1QJI1_SCOSC
MAPSVLLLLLGLLSSSSSSSSSSLPPPRTSFSLHSAERRLVFSLPDVHNYSTLLLGNNGSTLYVGARDAVLSLDVSQHDVITLKKKVEWSPSSKEITDCHNKGKNRTVDCPNFIQVLQQINSSHLYVCGSFAFSPHDAFIDTETFSIAQSHGAKSRCPFNPFQRNSAITIGGELFTATTTDFRGVKPQISRHFSKDGRPDISQDTSVNLLEEPTFVSSSLDPEDGKLYFFFSEVGKEFSFIDELRIARVAQVCKDDVGGEGLYRRSGRPSPKLLCSASFQKSFPSTSCRTCSPSGQQRAALPQTLCSTASSPPSAVFSLLLFRSSAPQSAVCVFKLQDFRIVFSGSYKSFDMESHQWSLQQGKHPYLGKCGQDRDSDSILAEVKKTFLTSDSVKPAGDAPIFVSSEQSYSRVAAMTTKAANGKEYTILFLLSESGFLHKVALLDQGPRVIEEIQLFTQHQLIKNIVLSSPKGVLYVGTSEGVTAVPVAKCSVYRSCIQCVLARDPFCGWSRTRKLCTAPDSSADNMIQILDNGNVEEECDGQTEASANTEINVNLNKVVTLDCLKPSNLATLIWTSPRFKVLPKKLFIQSAEGSLIFHASTASYGTYRCEAEEGGHKQVVKSYYVQQIGSPHPRSPPPEVDHMPDIKEESDDESIMTEVPMVPVMTPVGDPEDNLTQNKGAESTVTKDKAKTNNEEPTIKNTSHGGGLDSTRDAQSWKEQLNAPTKSYYSELVVVSLLLAACILILMLAGLHVWRERQKNSKLDDLSSPEDGGKVNKCMESVPALSCAEDAGPELRV